MYAQNQVRSISGGLSRGLTLVGELLGEKEQARVLGGSVREDASHSRLVERVPVSPQPLNEPDYPTSQSTKMKSRCNMDTRGTKVGMEEVRTSSKSCRDRLVDESHLPLGMKPVISASTHPCSLLRYSWHFLDGTRSAFRVMVLLNIERSTRGTEVAASAAISTGDRLVSASDRILAPDTPRAILIDLDRTHAANFRQHCRRHGHRGSRRRRPKEGAVIRTGTV